MYFLFQFSIDRYLSQTTLVGMLKILYNMEVSVARLEEQNPEILEMLEFVRLSIKVCATNLLLDTMNSSH
jgi:hypothetical protein